MSIKNLRILMDGPEVTSNRRLNLFSIIIPLLGAVFALFSIPFLAITNTIVMIFIVFFLLNAIGVGTGLHRFFCHHAFATSTPVHYILAILGTAACQGPINRWVADHRRHHRFTDKLGDTHSPVFRGTKKLQRWSGFFHAHIGWMFEGHVSEISRYAPEINRNKIAAWASRNYMVLCAVGLMAPAIIGYAFGGFSEGLRCLLWAGFARVAILHQLTWSVNSIGHMYGSKAPNSADESRDNLVLALLLLGEGLHSSHHINPTAAVNGPLWLDWNRALLVGLEKLGVVTSLRKRSSSQRPID